MSTKEGEPRTISFQSYLEEKQKQALSQKESSRQLIRDTQLTRAERLIIVLYYYEDMTIKEISEELDLSEARVSQMHSSIIARLKSDM
jgi:RNA polymerase sigma factor for flagellar operon FliA